MSIWERRKKIVMHIQICFTQMCEKREYKPVRWERVKCKLIAVEKTRLHEPPTRQPRKESLPEIQVTVLASALSVVTWRAEKSTFWGEDAVQPWHSSPLLLRHWGGDSPVAWQLQKAALLFYSCWMSGQGSLNFLVSTQKQHKSAGAWRLTCLLRGPPRRLTGYLK